MAVEEESITFTVEEFAEVLNNKAADIVNSACILFDHNSRTVSSLTSQIHQLQEKNADLHLKSKTTTCNQEAITVLQKENVDLRAKLATMTGLQKENADLHAKLEMYVKREQFVHETIKKFRGVFGDMNPVIAPDIKLPLKNEGEAIEKFRGGSGVTNPVIAPDITLPLKNQGEAVDNGSNQPPGCKKSPGRPKGSKNGEDGSPKRERSNSDPCGAPRTRSRLAASSGCQSEEGSVPGQGTK